jgi:hypothetical protein
VSDAERDSSFKARDQSTCITIRSGPGEADYARRAAGKLIRNTELHMTSDA